VNELAAGHPAPSAANGGPVSPAVGTGPCYIANISHPAHLLLPGWAIARSCSGPAASKWISSVLVEEINALGCDTYLAPHPKPRTGNPHI
jgi:hypothetical protein